MEGKFYHKYEKGEIKKCLWRYFVRISNESPVYRFFVGMKKNYYDGQES